MEKLRREFYNRDTVQVARDLLGRDIVRVLSDGTQLVCRITETEAYVGAIDKACHAYNYRRTPRTETLFAQPGTAYIYLIYGMYHCLNFVTEPEGEPCAVLIRGAVPVKNGDIIAENRFGRKCEDMTAYQRRHFLNGPGKLCLGLGLTRAQNGLDLLGDELFLSHGNPPLSEQIRVGTRIGIDYAQEAVDFPWRFWLEE
ncbi:MAG: DNA-3-methyladenine glycosylase [Ruminococcaceae bacterium]|nr:DNA-3-methyladenine glycosylase [Oscillospiraceae bacterium]